RWRLATGRRATARSRGGRRRSAAPAGPVRETTPPLSATAARAVLNSLRPRAPSREIPAAALVRRRGQPRGSGAAALLPRHGIACSQSVLLSVLALRGARRRGQVHNPSYGRGHTVRRASCRPGPLGG